MGFRVQGLRVHRTTVSLGAPASPPPPPPPPPPTKTGVVVEGLEFRGLGFRVWGLGLRGCGVRVWV